MAGTIADWTPAQLERFIRGVVRQEQSNLPLSLTLQQLTATQKLIVSDRLELSPQAVKYLHQVMGV